MLNLDLEQAQRSASMILKGGINYYGIAIGVLGGDTRFPKPPGHIKHAPSFDFPILYRTIPGATVARILYQPDDDLCEQVCSANPNLGALVLECTDLSPHAHLIRRITGLAVFDLTTLSNMVYSAVMRKPYPGHMETIVDTNEYKSE